MNEYHPDSVSAPGGTLQDALEEREITFPDFAAQLGISTDHLLALLDGQAVLTLEIAQKLEKLLSIPADFWLAREARYREYLVQQPVYSEDRSEN